ncbi:MAG: dipicolinate synthase subunit B [Clostridia bacterium]|nr:dipicolinate synthase subunit B [Clostridia bacterium]
MKICLCITGSFCTLKNIIEVLKTIIDAGHDVLPIFSYNVSNFDTRFYTAKDFENDIITLTGKQPIKTIVDAEPMGTSKAVDLLLVAPCTGNTLSKIAHGITDTPVTMAVKATLRNNKPVVISVSSNDALGANARNIGTLLNTRNIFFVPFGQDDSTKKPNSLIADTSLVLPACEKAIDGKQLQPLFFS